MALTTYIILGRVQATEVNGELLDPTEVNPGGVAEIEVDTFEAFRKIGAVNAHSTEQAFRMAGEKHGAGHYAICSERSWNEETLEVETTTRVTVKPS